MPVDWPQPTPKGTRVITVTAAMMASLLMGRAVQVAADLVLIPADDLMKMPDRRDLAVKRFGGIEDAWLEG